MATSPITSSPASPVTTPSTTAGTDGNNESRSNSPASRGSPAGRHSTSPLTPRNTANPAVPRESTRNSGARPRASVPMTGNSSPQATANTNADSGRSSNADGVRPSQPNSIAEMLRSREIGAPIKRHIDSFAVLSATGSVRDVGTTREFIAALGTPGSRGVPATGILALPPHLQSEPLLELAYRIDDVRHLAVAFFGVRPRPILDYVDGFMGVADRIPLRDRTPDLVEMMDIMNSQHILPAQADRVTTPNEFVEFLGSAAAGRTEPTGIQALPAHLRSEALINLGLRIHSMQGGNVPHQELTGRLLAAIDAIPVESRSPNLTRVNNLARFSYGGSPSQQTRGPVDSVLRGVTDAQTAADFYNVNIGALNQEIAIRRSSSNANPN